MTSCVCISYPLPYLYSCISLLLSSHIHSSKTNSEVSHENQNQSHDNPGPSHDINRHHDREEPSQLVEPVAHYSSPPRGMKLRQGRSIVPAPSTDSTQHSLTPDAFRPSSRHVTEARQLREEALRLQEEREDDDLRARRKVARLYLREIFFNVHSLIYLLRDLEISCLLL